jgi:hypothetical protein
MTDTFRALCAELIQIVEEHCNPDEYSLLDVVNVLNRTRAALTQPEPEGASQQQIEELLQAISNAYSAWGWVPEKDFQCLLEEVSRLAGIVEEGWDATLEPEETKAKARAALARRGRPAIEPVSVSERLPGPEDCDASFQCWWFTPSEEKWIFWPIKWASPECSHWLPHWALPVPGVEGGNG